MDNGKDLRIPYDNIVKLSITTYKGLRIEKVLKGHLILNLLENQEITILLMHLKGDNLDIVVNHLIQTVNERACGTENEEAGWGLESTNNESLPSAEVPALEKNNSTEELEKIVDMYSKGLLTDDEFAAMKKRIIEK